MPYCPQCRTEYREGFDNCAECRVSLVDALPALPPSLPSRDLGEPTLLAAIPDDIEADMLLAMLKENDIPALKKNRGAGAYMNIYMGGTYLGAKIYVPEQLLNQAREIMESWKPSEEQAGLPEPEDELAEDDSPEEEETPIIPLPLRAGKILVWAVLMYIFASLIFGYVINPLIFP